MRVQTETGTQVASRVTRSSPASPSYQPAVGLGAAQPAARGGHPRHENGHPGMASAASEEPNDDNHDHDDDHDDENRLEHVSAFLSETVAPICTQRDFGALPRAYVDRFGRGVFGCCAQNAHENGEPGRSPGGRASVRVPLTGAWHHATRHGGCPPRTVLRRVPRGAVLPFGGALWPI
jgi:hypothetical protein